jgi:hypothetical protein
VTIANRPESCRTYIRICAPLRIVLGNLVKTLEPLGKLNGRLGDYKWVHRSLRLMSPTVDV